MLGQHWWAAGINRFIRCSLRHFVGEVRTSQTHKVELVHTENDFIILQNVFNSYC